MFNSILLKINSAQGVKLADNWIASKQVRKVFLLVVGKEINKLTVGTHLYVAYCGFHQKSRTNLIDNQ